MPQKSEISRWDFLKWCSDELLCLLFSDSGVIVCVVSPFALAVRELRVN